LLDQLGRQRCGDQPAQGGRGNGTSLDAAVHMARLLTVEPVGRPGDRVAAAFLGRRGGTVEPLFRERVDAGGGAHDHVAHPRVLGTAAIGIDGTQPNLARLDARLEPAEVADLALALLRRVVDQLLDRCALRCFHAAD
jgi:hypothetical protein